MMVEAGLLDMLRRTHRHPILVEDDVVGEAGVVLPGDGVALGDGHRLGVELQAACMVQYINGAHE